jgi:hypothetical protein
MSEASSRPLWDGSRYVNVFELRLGERHAAPPTSTTGRPPRAATALGD